MSYATERRAIETYLQNKWALETPIGFDGHDFEPTFNSIRVTIQNADVIQGSIGAANNRMEYIGQVAIQIFTESGKGTQKWREYAEKLDGIFFDKRITNTGALATTNEFIRFSPQQQHPYISGEVSDIPFHIATFIAPFVRYEYK
jgi:hypothetical protein